MRLAVRRSVLFGAFVLLVVTAFAGCQNPFDPVDKSSKIEGLTYIDFSLGWAQWDSDVLGDGVTVDVTYHNEFTDDLDFHDKPHDVTIEFWTEKEETVGGEDSTTTVTSYDQLFYSVTVEHSNSADTIRIPLESYYDEMRGAEGFDDTKPFDVFVIVKVYPPEDEPKHELKVGYSGQTIYEPVETDVTPNVN